MERFIEWASRVGENALNDVMSGIGAAVSLLNTPAYWLGVPPEILAGALLCLAMVAAWRLRLGGIR